MWGQDNSRRNNINLVPTVHTIFYVGTDTIADDEKCIFTLIRIGMARRKIKIFHIGILLLCVETNMR
jgi:hypothetical protein